MMPSRAIPLRTNEELLTLIRNKETPEDDRVRAAHSLLARLLYGKRAGKELFLEVLQATLRTRCEHGRDMVGSCLACETAAEERLAALLPQMSFHDHALKEHLDLRSDNDAVTWWESPEVILLGYRCHVRYGEGAVNPFNQDSSEAFFWDAGRDMARRDQGAGGVAGEA